jgi:hypothetical protein
MPDDWGVALPGMLLHDGVTPARSRSFCFAFWVVTGTPSYVKLRKNSSYTGARSVPFHWFVNCNNDLAANYKSGPHRVALKCPVELRRAERNFRLLPVPFVRLGHVSSAEFLKLYYHSRS